VLKTVTAKPDVVSSLTPTEQIRYVFNFRLNVLSSRPETMRNVLQSPTYLPPRRSGQTATAQGICGCGYQSSFFSTGSVNYWWYM